MQTLIFKQNDRLPACAITILGTDNLPMDLTGYTAKFTLWTADSDHTIKVDSVTASIAAPATGVISYAWGAGDLDTPGEYWGEFELTQTATGKVMTRPQDDQLKIIIVKNATATADTYKLTANLSEIGAGDSVDITLTTTDVVDGNIAYTITGIVADDLSAGTLTGDFALSDGVATLTFTLDDPLTTVAAESLTLSLNNGRTSVVVGIE